MRLNKKIVFALFVLTVSAVRFSTVQAQLGIFASRHRVVQFSGIVVNGFEADPIPFVTIYNHGRRQGTVSDANGYFTFVAVAGDSVRFSSIGFQTRYFIIPDTISCDAYSVVVPMEQDTIQLLETVVYPWPSKERFRDAFLHLELPESDQEVISRNFNLAAMREQARHGKMDANMNYRSLMSQETAKLYYQNQQQPNNLLNPFAWARFIQQIKRKKQADKLEKQQKEGYQIYSSDYEEGADE